MKKSMRKFVCFVLAALMLTSLVLAVEAPAADDQITPRASYYLSGYSSGLVAKGNRKMNVNFSVFGTREMDKIGVNEVLVEYWNGSDWVIDHHAYGSNHADFYSTNSNAHAGGYSFYGMPGLKYRATVTAYAELDGGSDTGEITSQEVVCVGGTLPST